MNTIQITLEPLTIKDSNQVFDLYTHPSVLQHYEKAPIADSTQTRIFMERITSQGCWSWKILSIDDERSFLGICSLHHFDAAKGSIEIGGTLFPQFWGKGIMLQAFLQLIALAKHDFGVKKVVSKTSSSNKQAIMLTKKLGFQVGSDDHKETILIKYLDDF